MQKINRQLKDAIVNTAIERSNIQQLKDQNKETENQLFERVRIYAFGGTANTLQIEQEVADAKNAVDLVCEKIDAKPWQPHYSKSIFVTDDGQREVILNSDNEALVPLKTVLIEMGSALAVDIKELFVNRSKADTLRRKITAGVNSMLARHNTVESLIAAWPEAAALIPEGELPPITDPRVDEIEKLNKALNL